LEFHVRRYKNLADLILLETSVLFTVEMEGLNLYYSYQFLGNLCVLHFCISERKLARYVTVSPDGRILESSVFRRDYIPIIQIEFDSIIANITELLQSEEVVTGEV